jgi:hypothetical protein
MMVVVIDYDDDDDDDDDKNILTQSQSSKYRCQMGAIEPPICAKTININNKHIQVSRCNEDVKPQQRSHLTSVNTNFAEAYCISTTWMPTVWHLLSASAVRLAGDAMGLALRLAAATAEAQWTKADFPGSGSENCM